jgi:hypothetical protein
MGIFIASERSFTGRNPTPLVATREAMSLLQVFLKKQLHLHYLYALLLFILLSERTIRTIWS